MVFKVDLSGIIPWSSFWFSLRFLHLYWGRMLLQCKGYDFYLALYFFHSKRNCEMYWKSAKWFWNWKWMSITLVNKNSLKVINIEERD